MRIVYISRGDASSGGAGRVAEQLATYMNERGHDVTHIIRKPARPSYRDRSTLVRGVKGDVLLRNLVATDISGLQLPFSDALWRADLVHFHDFAVAYGAMVAYLVALKKPTVFRLPDFSGVTGGCLYPKGCRRFQTGCGQCPQIGSWPLMFPLDLTEEHYRLHRRIANTSQTVGVTPSRYMADFAHQGAWSEGWVEVIPNAVDTEVFHPGRRRAGRARLGLGAEAKCLLFVAVNVLDERKGFDDFARAARPLLERDPDLQLAVVGDLPRLPPEYADLADRLIKTGPIDDDIALAEVYAAADLYVVPSRHDTFNITILEAMSSGTPVVAYPTGGMTEVFEDGHGGWFAANATTASLEGALLKALRQVEAGAIGKDSRAWVAKHFTVARLCERHWDVYRSVLNRNLE